VGTLSLFDEPPSFDREGLARRLTALAGEGVYIGTSSWKYEGWLGQIYTHDRYLSRGRFSPRRFHAECLAEYAEVFPVVCGDFSFYQFPPPEFWQRLFASAPHPLRFAFKVPEEITVRVFPGHPRYGPRAGEANPSFLNAAMFDTAFISLLRPWRERVAVLVLEFGTFSKQCYRTVSEFMEELDPFLAALPRDFTYAVEVRNPGFLAPEYLACLRRHGVAHVLSAWTRMPEIGVQLRVPGIETAGFTVARALLRQGRPYEEAVRAFSPYERIQDPNPETREALRGLISGARERAEQAYIFVNNRLEGNAPSTIEAITE